MFSAATLSLCAVLFGCAFFGFMNTETSKTAEAANVSIPYTVSAPYKYAYTTTLTSSGNTTKSYPAYFNTNSVASGTGVTYTATATGLTLTSTLAKPDTTITAQKYVQYLYSATLGATVTVPAKTTYKVTFSLATRAYMYIFLAYDGYYFGSIDRVGILYGGVNSNTLTNKTISTHTDTSGALAETMVSYTHNVYTSSSVTYPNMEVFSSYSAATRYITVTKDYTVTLNNTSASAAKMTTYFGFYMLLTCGGATGNTGYRAAAQLYNSSSYMQITKATVDATPVTKPAINGDATREYNGASQSFLLSGIDTSLMNITAGTGYDAATTTIVAKDAGTYTVTASIINTNQYIWADGTASDCTVTATITKRPLTISYEGSTAWVYDQSGTITIATDVLSEYGDSVNLSFYYANADGVKTAVSSSAVSESEGKYTLSLSGIVPGSYTLHAELDGDGASNGNYQITAESDAGHAFTVQATAVPFDENSLVWELDGVVVTDGASVTYNGSVHQVNIDTSGLALSGVKVDITKGTNGYTNNAVTNAGDYTTTVYITNYDETWEAYSGSFTFNWTIEKADYDFSNLKWTYNNGQVYPDGGLTYSNTKYTVTATGWPAGFTVVYGSNQSATNAGEYTVKVLNILGNDKNNYNDINYDDPNLTFNWKINAKEIDLDNLWSMQSIQKDGIDITVYNLAGTKIDGTAEDLYAVKYFRADQWGNGEPIEGEVGYNTLEEALPSDWQTTSTYVYMYAEKSALSLANNYSLTGNQYMMIYVGGDKTAVVVTLENYTKVFDGVPFDVTAHASADDGSTLALEYIYYEEDGVTLLPGNGVIAPTDAGKYVVKVQLKYADDYVITEASSFSIEIEKADYDIEGLNWLDGRGGTYGLADEIKLVYDGNSYTLSLDQDFLSDNTPGLIITLDGEKTALNKGKYTIQLSISCDGNYNKPNLPDTFTWEILPLSVDLSGVTWNYKEPFGYAILNGAPMAQSVGLLLPEGLPEDLVNAINEHAYVQSQLYTYSASARGSYKASANLRNLALWSGIANYDITYPATLAVLDWKIVVREIAEPVFDGSWKVFDLLEHDLAEFCGLPEDWSNYLDVEVLYTPVNGTRETLSSTVVNGAGTYVLNFTLKDGINGGSVGGTNVIFGENGDSATVTVNISPMTVTVTSWSGKGSGAWANYEEDPLGGTVREVIYNAENEEVEYSAIKNTPGSYQKTIVSNYGTNVAVRFVKNEFVGFNILDEQGTEEAVDPVIPDDPETPDEIKEFDIPTFAGGMVFTGAELDVAAYLNGFDSEYMEITVEGGESVLKAGAYTVIISLKNPNTSRWKNGSEAENMGAVKLSFAVTLADEEIADQPVDVVVDPFSIPVSSWTAVAGETPKFEGIADSYYECIDFVYTLEDGTVVDASELEVGTNYIVTATVKEEFRESLFLTGESGETLDSASLEFTFEKAPSWTDFFTQEFLGLALWIWLLIALAVLLLLIILIVAIKRSRKKKAQKQEAQAEEEKQEEERRREETREDDYRRDDERKDRIAAQEAGLGGFGGYGIPAGMPMAGGVMPIGIQQPVAPQPIVVGSASSDQLSDIKQELRDLRQDLKSQPAQTAQPVQPMQPIQPMQPVQTVMGQPVVVQPVQPVSEHSAQSEGVSATQMKEEIKDDLRDEFGHQVHVERLLETIATSREQDKQKFEQEEQERKERMQHLELRRKERMESPAEYHPATYEIAPRDPSVERIRELEGKLHSMEEMMWVMRFGGMQQPQVASVKDERIQQLENELREMKEKQEADSRRELEEKIKDMERRQELREAELRRQLEDERRRNDEDRRFREMEERLSSRFGYAPQAPAPAAPSVHPQRPVQQESAPQHSGQPAGHTVQPGSVMTTTTTTTIDATKDANVEDLPDYSSRFTSRRRN